MIVTCPNCSTRFNLPDDQSRPGAKMRCSVCKHVFALEEPKDVNPVAEPLTDEAMNLGFGESAATKAKKKRKKSPLLKILLTLVVLLGAGGAGVWFYAPGLVSSLLAGLTGKEAPVTPAEDLISRISLNDVRQYQVTNEKTGPLTVIEGKTVNGFNAPRELIRVEAALYDKDGRVLASKQHLAGNAVSLFQLQVLGEQELEQALSNKLGVLTYNTNVPPGGEVPFMIVFYNPPEAANEFGIKVVDARVPPAN